MARRRSTTKQWVTRQAADPYVKQRNADGYRSRSAFKLKEILARDRILHEGDFVLDLGASPGGWTQVAIAGVGVKGRVVGVDLLAMEPVNGTRFIEGDCRDPDTRNKIRAAFGGRGANLVISDMAPNITGIRALDEANILALADTVNELASEFLIRGGSMLIKLFQYPGTDSYIADLNELYCSIARRKPASSRRTSREFYVVATGFGI
ncbi:MAG: RlmE family RNA methyltransferase [Proteobacteria bacterium]|nr:MAG: RlmE family RNA methyltransferase [Pseudomonadota bacterium]